MKWAGNDWQKPKIKKHSRAQDKFTAVRLWHYYNT
jgi:hypothetical protein